MYQLDFTFNWFYADDRDIAMFSSGRVADPRAEVDQGLPTMEQASTSGVASCRPHVTRSGSIPRAM